MSENFTADCEWCGSEIEAHSELVGEGDEMVCPHCGAVHYVQIDSGDEIESDSDEPVYRAYLNPQHDNIEAEHEALIERFHPLKAEIARLTQRQQWMDEVGTPTTPEDERPWASRYLDARAEIERLTNELHSLRTKRCDLCGHAANQSNLAEVVRLRAALQEIVDADRCGNYGCTTCQDVEPDRDKWCVECVARAALEGI